MKDLDGNVLYPNTDTEGSHSTRTDQHPPGTAEICQALCHNSQNLSLSRKENSCCVNCRQTWRFRGSEDFLIFFFPNFHPLAPAALCRESSKLAGAKIPAQCPQSPGLGLCWSAAQAPPSKGAFSCQGFFTGKQLGKHCQGLDPR